MENVNNIGPAGRLVNMSNRMVLRPLGYYFNDQLYDNYMEGNTHLLTSVRDKIPNNVTCLVVNLRMTFERLNQLLCGSNVRTIVFYTELIVENINTTSTCSDIVNFISYRMMSLHTIYRYFPNCEQIYLYHHREKVSSAVMGTKNLFDFKNLKELHILTSNSNFPLVAKNLEKLSIYATFNQWDIDLKNFPNLKVLRLDENTKVHNTEQVKYFNVLQFFPPVTSSLMPFKNIELDNTEINDFIPPSIRKYSGIKKYNIIGVYVSDEKIEQYLTAHKNLQIYDNIYPLKVCSQRLNTNFYRYFPYPDQVNNELLEKFNLQQNRDYLCLIFNFDFMNIPLNFDLDNINPWIKWYRLCIDKHHRHPIIIQTGMLMLKDGTNDLEEKKWPDLVLKARRETVIYIPEEELIYINTSPIRISTLVEKIRLYRNNKYSIKKLWLITNGFQITTKDIEDNLNDLIVVHNEVKMYINF